MRPGRLKASTSIESGSVWIAPSRESRALANFSARPGYNCSRPPMSAVPFAPAMNPRMLSGSVAPSTAPRSC